MKKDWCSYFPEYIKGIYIGLCCKGHDTTLSTSRFYRCLRKTLKPLRNGKAWSKLIVSGGFVGAWVFHPIKMIKRLIK